MMDFSRKVMTRDGRPVRILATDVNNKYPIIGTVADSQGYENLCMWRENGVFDEYKAVSGLDLVYAPVVKSSDIPWRCLRPEIQWVAMDSDGSWFGYEREPERNTVEWGNSPAMSLKAVNMPEIPVSCWQETLVKRPGGGDGD